MPISSIRLIYGTNTTHKGTTYQAPFPGPKIKVRSLRRAYLVGWLHMWHSCRSRGDKDGKSSRGDKDGKKYRSYWIGITTCCSLMKNIWCYFVISILTSSKASKSHRRDYPCCRMNYNYVFNQEFQFSRSRANTAVAIKSRYAYINILRTLASKYLDSCRHLLAEGVAL